MTDTDSLAKVVEELRKFGMFETADRIERLDAEMRKALTDALAKARLDMDELSMYATQYLRESEELRARLAACETALRNIAAIEDEQYGGDWDEIERARKYANAALATPTAHPDVPVKLCHICGALVPVAESEAHCAGHSKQLVSNQK